MGKGTATRQAADKVNAQPPVAPGRAPQFAANPWFRLQRSIGNQAVLRLFHDGILQAKLASSSAEDPYEQEADRATEQVAIGTSIAAMQHKCVCGGSRGLSGECEECSKKKRFGLQTKLKVNEPGDIYEQEADRVADQVLATPAHPGVSGSPPRIQRFSANSNGQMQAAPVSVERALASPGSPLNPALRQDMEQRFGHDFSKVRVHSDGASERSARHVNAHAYTSGYDIVFGPGRFAPGTIEGRCLLAHELTHVVQQTGAGGGWVANPATAIQRDDSGFSLIPDPKDLVEMYFPEMVADNFDGIADRLVFAVMSHPNPSRYVLEVFKAIPSKWEDNLGAAFIKRLPNWYLDRFAATSQGRYALNIVYEAIITGDVSEFEREQAKRIIETKLRQIGPEAYIKGAKRTSQGAPTPIFPVRFMRVTGGDYAPPLAKMMPNGHIRVRYPVAVGSMSMFKDEMRTLGDVFGAGMDLNPNEIVGIKDYEKGGDVEVQYLPALVLIDYSNQAIQSTSGKIVEVSITAATLGFGGGAVAGGRAAAEEMVTSTAIWGARLAKTAQILDRAANVIGIASFVINEHRDWIIRKLGWPGKRLVQLSDIANNAANIYGLGRLAQGGYQLLKDLRAASNDARALGKELTAEESKVLNRIDAETDAMLKEAEASAAKSGRAAAPTTAEKPAVSGHAEDPASAKGVAKGAKELADERISARLSTSDGHEITITKDGTIWICTDPCEVFAHKYRSVLDKNKELAEELEKIKQIADPGDKAKAIENLKPRADKAPITEWQYLPLDGTVRKGNVLRLEPDDWKHILESHVKSTFDASKRGAAKVSTVFKGTPAQYLEILDEAVKNKAVIRELHKHNFKIGLSLRGQEWILSVDPGTYAIKTFHATGPINPKLFDIISVRK